MAKQNNSIEADGVIVEDRSNSFFLVELDNGHQVLCTIAGKLRQNNIRLSCGDRVQVVLSVYDLTKGRISYRYSPDGSRPSSKTERESKNKNFNKKKR